MIDFIEERRFKKIHTYLPMGSEIDFYAAIQYMMENNLMVVCPKTQTKPVFENRILNSLDKLEDGKFGTKYPADSEEYRGEYDLIVVPGLAFDSENYRLGYGGGYYDYFLSKHPHALKVGLFYSFQLIDSISVEAHDIALNMIITEVV